MGCGNCKNTRNIEDHVEISNFGRVGMRKPTVPASRKSDEHNKIA